LQWLAAGLSAFVVLGCSAASNSSSGQTAPWKQVWADNFDGPADGAVNTKYWDFNTGRGIFGTGEVETMTSSLYNVPVQRSSGRSR
jgi:hypothetical protein